MTEANPIRGEQRISFGGADYIMRPAYGALQAIEDSTGLSIFTLAMQAGTGSIRTGHIDIVVCELVKADLREQGQAQQVAAWKVETVGHQLMNSDAGHLGATLKVAKILNAAATGGYTAKGEAKAAAESETIGIPVAA